MIRTSCASSLHAWLVAALIAVGVSPAVAAAFPWTSPTIAMSSTFAGDQQITLKTLSFGASAAMIATALLLLRCRRCGNRYDRPARVWRRKTLKGRSQIDRACMTIAFSLAATMVISSPTPALAATWYWDANGSTAGFGTAGGTWTTTTSGTPGWSSSSAGTANTATPVTTGTDDRVQFGTASAGLSAGAIIVSGTVATNSMQFGTASGNITFSGTSQNGTINFGETSTINVSNSSQVHTLGTRLTGASTQLTKQGAGTIVFQGNNSGFGAGATLRITGGALRVGNLGSTSGANALGDFVISLGDSTGASNTVLTLNNSITLPNDITVVDGTASQRLTANASSINATFSGNITANGNLTVDQTNTGGTIALTGTANTIADGKVVTFSQSDTGFINNAATWSGLGRITYSGTSAGAVNVRGENTYSGTTSLQTGTGGGPIVVWAGSTGTSGPFGVGSLTFTNAPKVRSGTTADITLDNAVTISSGTLTFPTVANEKSLTFTGSVTLGSSTRTLNIGVGSTVAGKFVEFAGAVEGAGGITKSGSGMAVFSAANTYTGPTSVTTGTLRLAAGGSINASTRVTTGSAGVFDVTAAGTYVIPSVQTLAGTGTVAGTVTTGSGATLAPGASLGTLTFAGDLSWNAASNYNWQMLSGTGTAGAFDSWDLVSVSGSLSIASTSVDPFKINLWTLSGISPDVSGSAASFNPAQNYSWKIATAAGGISGFAADKFAIVTGATNGTGGFANALGGGTFSIAQSGNDLNLVFTANTGPTVITITVASGTQTQTQAGYPTLSGSTPVVKAGGGTLVLDQANPLTGSTTVQGGVLQLANGSALAASRLVVVAGGTGQVAPQITTSVAGLDLATGNGLMDVTAGALTISAGMTAAELVAEIIEGRGDGTWTGTSGITSSTAAAEIASSVPRAVGWLDNGDGSLTAAYAAPGDTNIDWSIDILDASNFLAGGKFDTGAPATWFEGDFSYDGIVDILDAADFFATGLYDAGNYNTPPTAGVAAVPEPTAATLIRVGAGLATVMAGRRISAGRRGAAAA